MFPIAKHGMRHVDALHMTSIRYVLASLAFLALLAAREGRAAVRFDGRALRPTSPAGARCATPRSARRSAA